MKRLVTILAVVSAFSFTACTRESPEPGMGTGSVGGTQQPYDETDTTGAAQDGTLDRYDDGIDTGTVNQQPTTPGQVDDTTTDEDRTTTY